LVQVNAEPIKPTIMQLQKKLGFIGKSAVSQKLNNTIIFKFEATAPPKNPIRLKVEINCREHLCIYGHEKVDRAIHSSWYNGNAELLTYSLEELLGSKMRALYQRRKGRDGQTERKLKWNGLNRFTSSRNMNKRKQMAANGSGDILKKSINIYVL